MALLRTKAKWSIPGAGTAYSIFHFRVAGDLEPSTASAQEAHDKTRTFFNDLRVALPAQVNVTVMGEVEQINEANGEMLAVWPVTTAVAVVGGAAAATGWSAPTGSVVSWSTAGIRNGRRIRGRTFIVPMTTGAYDTDGTLRPGEMGLVNTASTNIRTLGGTLTQFSVYARPTTKTATDGIAYPVASHRVPDMCAILRSRRS